MRIAPTLTLMTLSLLLSVPSWAKNEDFVDAEIEAAKAPCDQLLWNADGQVNVDNVLAAFEGAVLYPQTAKNPDGFQLEVAGDRVILRNPQFEFIRELDFLAPVKGVGFSQKGRLFVVGLEDQSLRLYDLLDLLQRASPVNRPIYFERADTVDPKLSVVRYGTLGSPSYGQIVYVGRSSQVTNRGPVSQRSLELEQPVSPRGAWINHAQDVAPPAQPFTPALRFRGSGHALSPEHEANEPSPRPATPRISQLPMGHSRGPEIFWPHVTNNPQAAALARSHPRIPGLVSPPVAKSTDVFSLPVVEASKDEAKGPPPSSTNPRPRLDFGRPRIPD